MELLSDDVQYILKHLKIIRCHQCNKLSEEQFRCQECEIMLGRCCVYRCNDCKARHCKEHIHLCDACIGYCEKCLIHCPNGCVYCQEQVKCDYYNSEEEPIDCKSCPHCEPVCKKH